MVAQVWEEGTQFPPVIRTSGGGHLQKTQSSIEALGI